MDRRIWSWLALPFLMLLMGCPDGGGGGGGFEGTTATIVYRADQTTSNVFELFLVGSGTRLNPPLGSTQTVQTFALTPDKSAVVYIADQDTPTVFELFVVSLNNPGSSTKLSPTGPTGINGLKDVHAFKVIPDGSGVVYLADQDTDGVNELYLVRFASPGVITKLNPTLTPNGDVLDFNVTANSTRVIYRADQDIDSVVELYQTVLATVSNSKLHADYSAGHAVTEFKLLANSAGVLYTANQTTSTVVELFETLFAGGTTGATVNDGLVSGGNVIDFALSPDSNRIVYRADQETVGVIELYLVELASLTNSVKLNGTLPANGNVDSRYAVTPDSASVVYVADQDQDAQMELYRTVFSGLANTRLLPGLITRSKAVSAIGTIPDSSGMAYIADQDTAGTREVYRVLFADPGATTKLSPVPMAGDGIEIVVESDSRSVIYRADQTTLGTIELYRTYFSTLGNTKLNAPLASGRSVTGFAL